MRISRGRAAAAALAVSSLTVGGAAIAQRERLPAECRLQIMDLCRGAESGIRQCVITALPKLSDDCRKAIGDKRMGDRRQGGGESVKAGANASVVPVPEKSHRSLNMELSEHGDFATGEVDRFLAGVRQGMDCQARRRP